MDLAWLSLIPIDLELLLTKIELDHYFISLE